MDIINNPNSVNIIDCKHCYHSNCLSNWLVRGNPRCPICNLEVFGNDLQRK